MSNNQILAAALAYAAAGFHVFPVHGIVNEKCTCGFPICNNAGKHPAIANGFKGATTNPETIKSWFSNNQWNVAIRTGAESRIWVLDIDGIQGEESLNNLEKIHGRLPPTMESTTGRGRHLIFRHTGEEIKNSSGKIGVKIDTRGDGGYIVAPPSQHHSGAVYTLNELAPEYAPDWLYALAMAEKPRTAPQPPQTAPDQRQTGEWDVADVRGMLDAIDPDLGYQEWVNVGMALHEGGYSATLWDEWSRRGGKYKAGECVKKYNSFKEGNGITMGTLVRMAQLGGWEPRAIPAESMPEIESIFSGLKAAHAEKKKPTVDAPPAPAEKNEIVNPELQFPDSKSIGGLIGETIQWILETAIKPQPELALLHVITTLGAVFGRRYQGQGRFSLRTNLYTVGIAGTGSGKDHSRKQLSNLMNKASLQAYIGATRFVSDAGLVTALTKKTSQIMAVDEFGLVMQVIADKKAAGYLKNIATHLLTLYTSSSSFFSAGQYADKEKDEVIIPTPNLCIYGTSTLDQYVKALTRDAVASGELNRFVVIPAKNKIPERNENDEDDCDTSPPQALVAAWEMLKPQGLAAQNTFQFNPDPTIVIWQKDIGARLKEMGLFEDDKMRANEDDVGALWNRYRENTLKIAMILAIARNQTRPEIVAGDLDIAENIVYQSTNYMTELCIEHMSDSEHQQNCQRIFKLVKRHGEISQTLLWKQDLGKMKAKDLEDVLKSLELQGKIEMTFTINGTTKRRTRVIKVA